MITKMNGMVRDPAMIIFVKSKWIETEGNNVEKMS